MIDHQQKKKKTNLFFDFNAFFKLFFHPYLCNQKKKSENKLKKKKERFRGKKKTKKIGKQIKGDKTK